ncbi:MAG: hypothetical protein WBW88_00175 [Rhodothermales bacterium]
MMRFRRDTRFLRTWTIWPMIAGLLVVGLKCNPFAPGLEEGDPFADFVGDPTTVAGFFDVFRNAYELRDISLYEPLIDSSFVFVYRDFDAQIDRQWGFTQELETTRRLFQSADFIRLQWNQIIAQDFTEENRRSRIIRSFNLAVSIEGSDVLRGDGNVNFTLVRPDSGAAWRLSRWRDESEL